MILRARERGHSAFCANDMRLLALCDRTASIALAIGSARRESQQPAGGEPAGANLI
jgi:hypothetical protein